jgi:hypothetical protein
MELERGDIVSKQGDYYREAFFREYFYKYKDPEADYLGKTRLVTIKAFLRKNNNDIYLRFRPRANTYDCFYFKADAYEGHSTGRKKLSDLPFTIEKNADILVFDENGQKVSNILYSDGYLINLPLSKEYEIVPEYSPIRKYEYTFSDIASNTSITEELAHRILYSNNISPWNIENPEILVFNGSGNIVTGETLPTSGIIDIYTNYDLGLESDGSAPTAISGFSPTREFIPGLSDNQFYTLISNVLSEAIEDSGTVKSSVFPLMVEDYSNPELINEQSKVVDSHEVKLHRVLGSGDKEYLFVDDPNTNGIDTFRDNMASLLDDSSDAITVDIDNDLDNLKYALWSMFCATTDKLTTDNPLYNKITIYASPTRDPNYDNAGYAVIDEKIIKSEYIIIPCSANISASYIALLSEETYTSSQKYLMIKNVSLVKKVEYTPGRCALVYVAPNDMSAYKYIYIPNWIQQDSNGTYMTMYTLKHSNS